MRFRLANWPRSRIAAILLLASAATATHPKVNAVVPRGGQRGTEVTLTIYGERLQKIEGLILFRKGIEVLEVKPERANRARVRIRIAADCPLGSHPLLVRTALGLSELHLFKVGTMREVSEKEPNNDRNKAQKVPLEVTVNGRVTNEDLDVFAIDVAQGQRINFEVEALRLGDGEFDVHMTVHDDKGKKLAVVDDTIFALLDPMASLTCKRAGRWFITLRENARGGTATSFYRLHVGTFPRPLVAFPAGGKPGTETKARLIGDGATWDGAITVPTTPSAGGAGVHWQFITTKQGTSPTPIYLAGSSLPDVFERGLGSKQLPGCSVKPWSMIGPFANPRDKRSRSTGHDSVFPPEKGSTPSDKYAGRDGPVTWKAVPKLRDNVVHDLRRIIKKSDHCVLYLTRRLDAPSDRRVLCLLSGDDTLKAWCNGKLVLNDAKPSRAVQNQHRLLLDLKKGQNHLLLKISNRGGGLGFFCRILDPLRIGGMRTVKAPAVLNGIIGKASEQDRFAFLARKGEALNFRVFARGLRSPLDPSVGCYCTHDRFYVGNDDSGGMDSLLRFRAPFTGEFVFTIRDMLTSGGPRYVYRVVVDRPRRQPLMTRASLPGFVYEWTVSVPAGGRDAIMIATRNLDTRAGVQLSLEGLPAGVTAHIPQLQRGATSVPVVFESKPDTAHCASLLQVHAKATAKKLDLSKTRFSQPVVVVRARNNRTYISTQIDRLPLAVVNKAPFTLTVAKIEVPLVRNSPIVIPFKIVRAKGFAQSVRVRMLYNPPGISSNQVTVAKGKSAGSLYLNANGSVRVGVHKIVLVGAGNVFGAPVSSSSHLVDLSVSKPWISATLGKVRTELGKKVTMEIAFKRAKKFNDVVEAQWIGVPRDISFAKMKIAKDTAKLVVPITIGQKAPPGRHRSFRLRLRIKTDKGQVWQDFRGGEIRIDRPRTKRSGS